MTGPQPLAFHPGTPGHRLWSRLGRGLLWSGCLWLWSASLALAVSVANNPPPLPALDPAIVQSQAPGDSRLLVKRRTPLPGSLLNAPAPQLRSSIRMAYETSLGNALYTVRVFENLPLAYMQAIARALAKQPDIVSASVLNDHDKALYGTEMTVPFAAIHTDQAFELYIPRKGGQNAPVVLILGCVGGDLPAPPGMPRLLILPNLAIAAAEQYGAVVACMSPAESETDLTHMSPAQLTTLAARQAANDAAIQGVLARIGQLTGASLLRVKLVGGQTAVAADGPAIALRYAFTYPSQVDRLVLDNQMLPPVPYLQPAAHSRPPASRPVQLAVTALLPDTAPASLPAWIASVQQLASQQHVPVQAAIRTYHDCGQDLACPIGPSGEMPMVFSALLGPPPAGTAMLSLSVGPDRQISSGGSLFLPELISGMVLGQAGSNAAPGLGWTSADGSPLPTGAVVTKSGLHEQLQFTPTQPGHYAFRLRLEDIKGNLVQAYANVAVPNPAPATRLTLAVNGPAQVVPGARVLLQARVAGSARPGDVLYEWQQTGGPVVTLPARNLPVLQFTAPRQPARLAFRLLVTDPSGQVAANLYTQQVKLPPPPPAKQPQPAKPPVSAKKPQPATSPGPARKPLPAKPSLPARPPQPVAKPLPTRPPVPLGKPVLAKLPLPVKKPLPASPPARTAPVPSSQAAHSPAQSLASP